MTLFIVFVLLLFLFAAIISCKEVYMYILWTKLGKEFNEIDIYTMTKEEYKFEFEYFTEQTKVLNELEKTWFPYIKPLNKVKRTSPNLYVISNDSN